MGSPGQPTPTSVRGRLLAAAEELFYAEGIAGTGVDAVVERAGVATGSLYKNFGGKDGLVTAYLEERDRRWRDLWEAAVEESLDAEERVLAVFTATARWTPGTPMDRGCAHLAAAVQLPRDHPGRRAALAHKEHLAHRLRELCADLDVDDPDELCRDLLVVYEGMNNQIALAGGADPVARARRLSARLIDERRAARTRRGG